MTTHTFQFTAAVGGRLTNWYFDTLTDFEAARKLSVASGLVFLTGEANGGAPCETTDTVEDFALWLDALNITFEPT